jgi:energy-coupling factor transporter ATP-binding protein EcfA2
MIRLISLDIHQFRGIRSLSISFDKKNAAFLGPNGSGKSSVVDALDFLFTGSIRRLTGEGTGSVSVGRHGPHIDATAEEAIVVGVLDCPDCEQPIEIRRCVKSPDALEIIGRTELPESLRRYLALATSSGLHLLTRREILSLILAEPGKRSDLVGALLRIEPLDSLRKELLGATKLAADASNTLTALATSQRNSALRAFLNQPASSAEMLERVNAHRLALGGTPLGSLAELDLLNGLPTISGAASNPLQSQRTKSAVSQALTWFTVDEQKWLDSCDRHIKELIGLRQNPTKLLAIRTGKLIRMGLALTEADYCPLCRTAWKREDLTNSLNQWLHEAREAQAEAARADASRQRLKAEYEPMVFLLRALAADLMGTHASLSAVISQYVARFEEVASTCGVDVVDGAVPEESAWARLCESFRANRGCRAAIDSLTSSIATLPNLKGAQQAWDELSAAERILSELRVTVREMRKARAGSTQLNLAYEDFIKARDEVLQSVYDAISERLALYYAEIHGADEDHFMARLDPTTAGLKLGVAFHGRGEFPPGAVHSEGHQDSMGVCLFLALVEHLGADIGPVVLDDVVMSVDRDHRRGVAALLQKHFPYVQFILTTHDRVWWHQLRTLGVTTSKGAHEFSSWTLGDGPVVGEAPASVMGRAREALTRGDIPGAAHLIRRAVEFVGPELCHQLGAKLRFRADGSWTAGEYMDSAISRYRQLLKKGKAAANSWNQDLTPLVELDERFVDANARLGGERWAVNATIHFNEWADLGPADFEPVLRAHEDLLAAFVCSACAGQIYLLERGVKEVQVRCPCNGININLEERT